MDESEIKMTSSEEADHQEEIDLGELEKKLGYVFHDRSLLRVALTNPSYRASHPEVPSENDNQRLEFLGDAVFGLLSAEQLYYQYEEAKEGMLSRLRSHLASGIALASLARKIDLGPWLKMGKGEELRGGHDKDKYLTDTMEAIFGAAWCDGGLDAVRKIYKTLDVGIEQAPTKALSHDNPKGQLQTLAQRNKWPNSPRYILVSQTGPCHALHFVVRAEVSTGQSAEGTGSSKRLAEADAAANLLKILCP